MRIAIANRISCKVGGVEEYIGRLVPALLQANHEIACWFEYETTEGPALELPRGTQTWAASALGLAGAMGALRGWHPDVIYCNGLDTPEMERAFTGVAASVYSAHSYVGTCISGQKMHAFPRRVPCGRVFGRECLAQFYPRRCGGLNPITMLRRYGLEQSRLEVIRAYDAVVVHSSHMQQEFGRHGINACLVELPLLAREGESSPPLGDAPMRLLFLGRLDSPKGGDLLLHAAEILASRTPRRIELVVAGDGVDREKWSALATKIMRRTSGLEIRFVGWAAVAARQELFEWAHILAMPSCWPEPFGMVGMEAAAYGLPSIAFDVGGIHDWLRDGVNGVLVPADPPTAATFAAGLERCAEPARHRALREGARQAFRERTARWSIDSLEEVFKTAIDIRQGRCASP